MTLAEFLQREMDRRNWSLRDAEAHTGVSRAALTNILQGDEVVPTLGTLKRLGLKFGVPLWRMVELAGFDTQIGEDTPSGRMARIVALARAMPQLAEALDQMADLHPEDLEGVLVYLEALKARRDRAGLGPGEPAQ